MARKNRKPHLKSLDEVLGWKIYETQNKELSKPIDTEELQVLIAQLPDDSEKSRVLDDPNHSLRFERVIRSKYVIDEETKKRFWLAEHSVSGFYYTSNQSDPKILNTSLDEPRPRGNVDWTSGNAPSKGRPKGALNKVSVKAACANLDFNPAELLVGIAKGDIATLKKHRIKNPQDITINQKILCTTKLLDKLVPNLKPVDTDEEGNILGSREVKQLDTGNDKPQIQVYLPSTNQSMSIDATPEEIQEVSTIDIDQITRDSEQEIEVKL